MERAQGKFDNLFKVALAYKQYMNIYLFLKECAFRTIFNAMKSYPINPDEKIKIDHLYNSFQMEISQCNWNIYQMTQMDYQGFLEYYYNTINYDSTDKSMFEVARDVTENVAMLGAIDELSQKRSKVD